MIESEAPLNTEMSFAGIELQIPEELQYAFEPFNSPKTAFGVNGEVNEVQAFMRHIRGRKAFLDVGSLFGFFSLIFAKATAGKVMALEPSGPAIEKAEQIAALNRVQIEFLNCAAGASCGVLKMVRESNHDHLLVQAQGDVEVPVTTIDALVAERGFKPDAVKIDTEGYELEILRGAEQVITALRPVIFLELHLHFKYGNRTFFPYDLKELERLLQRHRYRVETLFGEEVKSLSQYCDLMLSEHHRLVLIP